MRSFKDNPVQLWIEIFHPGNSAVVADLQFDGYLSNLSGAISPSWTEESMAGRADPILKYSKISQNLRISLAVPAFSPEQHDNNYLKINQLTGAVYPVYRQGIGFNGPHIKFYVGSGLNREDAFMKGMAVVTSLNHTWQDTVSWNVAQSHPRTVNNPYPDSKILKSGAPTITNIDIDLNVVSDPEFRRLAQKEGTIEDTKYFNLKKYTL